MGDPKEPTIEPISTLEDAVQRVRNALQGIEQTEREGKEINWTDINLAMRELEIVTKDK